ncbi:histidinol-phosphatase [Natronolimnobius sp. AArcel1]|uniref:PHP domain-containing protein n=1 Tax=Natronolimnobius sp. AArcel1 TaxID=1679093 RepID=UPI0013EB6A6C|nr:PHP domain-containing protein [Natronolimnobius sp. AArcel1]NGM71140.1 histidinol-phosphatase [Natronolimnobius sp. AArcel1]
MKCFHAHSNYSDGEFLFRMARAAADAGLEGLGFADHCNVASRESPQQERQLLGFNLDLTYERRRQALNELREQSSIEIYDAVEMDYVPHDEPAIRAFLEEANFDYTLGSVHQVDEQNVQDVSNFTALSADERDEIVTQYFDNLVALVESELFDVAAHVDLLERTPPLRGRSKIEQYHHVAEAFANSRTVPEINAGRALTDAAIVHPDPSFLEILQEYDVSVTVGTDSHEPAEIGKRAAFLEDFVAETDLEVVEPPSLD